MKPNLTPSARPEHKLAAVWPLAERYSNLEPNQPFVAEIVVRPLDKQGGAPG